MEPLAALDLATSTFVDVLTQVGDAQLGVPTPCEEWDVAALVGHDDAGQRIMKAGVMAIVVEGGDVMAGDGITVILPPLPHRRLEKV